jgi:hypothetical protein
MRALILAITLAAAGFAPPAQSTLSPRRTAEAVVDGVTVTIEYGAPSKRGRVIWGGLRPWDEWWMPGADTATSITTSGPLRIGTLDVPAGAHSIYTLPGEREFLLIINGETGQFHTRYNPARDLGRTPMTLRMLTGPVEQMTFTITPHEHGGSLALAWDDREYAAPLAAPAR